MKVTGIFRRRNPEFSQEIADQYHEGNESDANFRHLWEDEIEVSDDVTDFKIRNHAVFVLQGALGEEETFRYEIPEMTICDCQTAEGELVQFAVSTKLIHKTEKKENKETGEVRFIFQLKGKKPCYNPIPGVFIRQQDFPAELEAMEEEVE